MSDTDSFEVPRKVLWRGKWVWIPYSGDPYYMDPPPWRVGQLDLFWAQFRGVGEVERVKMIQEAD